MEDLKVTRLDTYSGSEPLPEHSPDAHEATIQDEKDRRFEIFLKYLPRKLEGTNVSLPDAVAAITSRKKEILDSCKDWEKVDEALENLLKNLLSGELVNAAAAQEKAPADAGVSWDDAFQPPEERPWLKTG